MTVQPKTTRLAKVLLCCLMLGGLASCLGGGGGSSGGGGGAMPQDPVMRIVPPNANGSVVVSMNTGGGFAWAIDRGADAAAAERAALEACRRQGGDECEEEVAFGNACAAVAVGGGRLGWAQAATRAEAERAAIAECNSGTPGANCAVAQGERNRRGSVCFGTAGTDAGVSGKYAPPESPNRPPTVQRAVPAQMLIAGASETVDLSPHFADPDGDPLTYAATSSDEDVATVSVSGSQLTVRAAGAGAATARVTASDPDETSVTLEFAVQVMSNNRESLPPPTEITSAPQAAGHDAAGVVVAGAGTTAQIFVQNSRATALSVRAGTWFEPKSGNAQRMVVTQTTSVAPGETKRVPAACMQRGKATPPTGLRFFSEPQPVSGSVQQCQARCLGEAEQVQNCVWGCEREDEPESASVAFTVEDSCNDRYPIDYRFFAYPQGSSTPDEIWPSSSQLYYTGGLGQEYTHRLTCTPGQNICYGAKTGNRYWGVGIDGDERCSDCCIACPQSGNARPRTVSWGCDQEDEEEKENPSVTFTVEDACNDGYRIDYRFFAYSQGASRPEGVWPSWSEIFHTRRLGEEHSHSLSCTPGQNICYGARTGDVSWGVGIGGDEGCSDCCVACPQSGEARSGRSLTCR